MTDPMAQARQHFLQGVTHYEAGRLGDAERSFEAALALAPGRPSVLANLGAARVRLGKFDAALPVLAQASAAEPGNADAWGHLGTACAELGHMEQALDAFSRALQINPQLTEAWSRRGGVLRELGQLDDAAECFERAIALGADDELHRYYLASVRGATPPAPPRDYVQALFDSYADDFQGHLTGDLRYQAHEVLVRHLPAPRHASGRWRSVLDLGCGTGLCGALVRGRGAERITGVDLSERMLAQAAQGGAYDELIHADITPWLAGALRQDDLVLAADVFIYVGALEPVFASVARLLAPGGTFAFSVEHLADADADADGGNDDGLRLLPSLRYAHSEAYLRRLAQAHGLRVANVVKAPIREDQRRPIDGLYLYLQGS